jgi:hypothetical protein
MKVELTCTYCGHKWIHVAYDRRSIVSEICPECKDRNLIAKDLDTSKIDYYAGSPPFAEDLEKWNK